MAKIYNSVEELVGKTPLLRLENTEKKYGLGIKLLAKLEFFNPCGSVKDRVALNMINDGEKRGLLKEGSVIIEPTSGNTGIGLAAIGVSRGYRVIIVMPETMSEERKILMRAYGAELVLTEGKLGMSGAIAKANELAASIEGSFIPGQFENPANPEAHILSTGPEIYEDTDGGVDFFVAGVGTGGSISGIGNYLKSKIDKIKVVAVEPASSAVLSGKKASSHGIQGIGAGFIPSTLDREVYDMVICVEDDEARKCAASLGRDEGILCGISSGAALSAAIKLGVLEENRGKTFVVLFPDSGERYLSSGLYENI